MTPRMYALPEELNGNDIKEIRKTLNLTQAEFSHLVHVSKKTVERWETGEKAITGPIVTLVHIFKEQPQWPKHLRIPDKTAPMRLWYMHKEDICTIIDVDERARQVAVYNFTAKPMFQAFGRVEQPDFAQYEEFLESRCFPRSRDKLKLELKRLDLPFYDPLMIIEKTEGRMAEDNFWICIER